MKRTALLVAAILVLALAASAQADSYIGVYGGYTYIPETEGMDYDDGATVGGKAGMWANTLPWVAVEVNVWNTWTSLEGGDDITLTNFTGSILLQYLSGPLRIYGGGGGGGTWSNNGDDELAWTALGQGGLEYEIVPRWAVFGEYRYTYTWFENVDLDRHEGLGGINFRF